MSRLLEVVHFCVVDRSVSLLRVAKDVMCQCVQFDRAATAQALRGLQASKRAAVVGVAGERGAWTARSSAWSPAPPVSPLLFPCLTCLPLLFCD